MPVHLWQIGLFGERCIFEEIGDARSCVALHIPSADIAQGVVISCGRLPANHTAEALQELLLH